MSQLVQVTINYYELGKSLLKKYCYISPGNKFNIYRKKHGPYITKLPHSLHVDLPQVACLTSSVPTHKQTKSPISFFPIR